MTEIITTTFQLKRGLTSAWERENPILAPGEPGWTLDTHVLKIGDGVTPWNDLLPINKSDYSNYVTEEELSEIMSKIKNYEIIYDASNKSLRFQYGVLQNPFTIKNK